MTLLPPDLVTRLGRLAFSSRRRAVGQTVGERRSQRRGNSQEFADHRPYVPGDDLRFLDWHLYGRLDALWVKLFEEEQDRVVQLLIDCSASMEGEKLAQARRLAGALSVVSLTRLDRVAVGSIDTGLRQFAPPRRGKEQLSAVFRSIEEVVLGTETDLVRAVDALPRLRGAGIAVLVTDFLFPQGAEPVLKRLLGRGLEVWVFHLFDPAELTPPLEGDLLVIDRETGEEVPVTLDEPARLHFEAQARAWMSVIEGLCRSLGVGYAAVSTQTPIEEVVLRDLRRLGVVR